MKVEILTQCPCCGSSLERVNSQLFCRNKLCSAQQGKMIENFTKKAKIKGFGEKTLEKLELETITDLYLLSKEYLIDIVGEKVGTKLYEELEKSLKMPLATFISALGIPMIGITAGNKVAKQISSVEEISYETCKQAGLGEKATASLLKWKLDEYPNYQNIPFEFTVNTAENEVVSKDITVCVTGRLEGHTRASIANLLDSLGVKVGSSVTTKTDFLICEELKGSSKEVKAKQLNIPIISLIEFKQRIK